MVDGIGWKAELNNRPKEKRLLFGGLKHWYRWYDGWFTYYICQETGEKSYEIPPHGIEIETPKMDDFIRSDGS